MVSRQVSELVSRVILWLVDLSVSWSVESFWSVDLPVETVSGQRSGHGVSLWTVETVFGQWSQSLVSGLVSGVSLWTVETVSGQWSQSLVSGLVSGVSLWSVGSVSGQWTGQWGQSLVSGVSL